MNIKEIKNKEYPESIYPAINKGGKELVDYLYYASETFRNECDQAAERCRYLVRRILPNDQADPPRVSDPHLATDAQSSGWVQRLVRRIKDFINSVIEVGITW